ncbi:MAG: hypothetical protein KatS3mg115_2501 [Candidatus Poribacteria bacterium]|nr:MAG: hypothetical protein KatS3mg115_2501 [Candidatus Poribacteria bacterium]
MGATMERLLSGEAALALGALRAKVQVVRGYPGSPGTGVLHRLLTVEEVDADWSVNEKVACEFCWGAAICGRRSLFCTKSLGLNVALDTLTTLNLVGTRAGFVILTGDDPGAYRSQNEEDSRHFGPLLELPMLEPRSVPESVALIEFAFELSERHALPVLVRITRAFAFHQEETDPVGAPSSQTDMKPVDLDQDRRERRWIASTENVIPRRRELHQKLRAVAEELSRLPWVERSGDRSAPLGLIAGGFMVTKLRAILSTLELREPWELLALSPVYPLPEEPIARFLGGKRRVLILEEGDPILEEGVAAIAGRAGLSPQIYGKRTGPFPAEGELLAEPLAEGLADFFGLPRPNPERLTAFREPPLNPNPKSAARSRRLLSWMSLRPDV